MDLFTRTVLTYDPKEMGDLAFSFRCSDAYVLQNMVEYLRSGAYFRLLQKAMENRKVKKKLAAYDCTRVSSITNDAAHTAYFILPPKGKKK